MFLSIHAKFVDNALYKARSFGRVAPATPGVKAKSTHINLVRGFREKIQIMPNTYSQIYIHYVFAVHSQDTSLDVQWRESLYQYIGGIVMISYQRKPKKTTILGIAV